MPIAPPIILAQKAQVELHTLARAHTTPPSLALRARMVFRAAAVDQPTNLQSGRALGCSNLTVGKWRRRYLEWGLPGLQDAPRSGRPRPMAPTHTRPSHLGGQCFATRPQARRHEVDASGECDGLPWCPQHRGPQ